jgi:hypothetical protein
MVKYNKTRLASKYLFYSRSFIVIELPEDGTLLPKEIWYLIWSVLYDLHFIEFYFVHFVGYYIEA